MVEAVAHVNVSIMRRARVPKLYAAGVIYRLEPELPKGSVEEIENCLQVLALAPRIYGHPYGRGTRWTDCDGAVAYRLGELWCAGEPATARIVWRADLRKSKHAQVRRADGTIEDPCMILRRNEQEGRIGCAL